MQSKAPAYFSETQLAALAKKAREATGKNRAEAARELGVARPTVVQAEDNPEQSLTKLRIRIIEAYSSYRVAGPLFCLKAK
jgi:DNA-binding XRE family transcriptional regulator